jgi:hypothetical protein
MLATPRANAMTDDWSAEETDDPLYADRRNFYKVEKWSKDGQPIEELLFAGPSGCALICVATRARRSISCRLHGCTLPEEPCSAVALDLIEHVFENLRAQVEIAC